MKKRILLTGGGGAGTESIWKSLSEKYELFFADADIANIDDLIPSGNKVEIPLANSPLFLSELNRVLTKLEIDLLVPGVDEELIEISRHKDKLCSDTLIPNVDFVETMLDKFDFIKSLEEKGINAPKTRLIDRSEDIGYPQILKPRKGRGSRGVFIVNTLEEADAHKTLYKLKATSAISQELIRGVEYTVLVAADKSGQLTAICPVLVEQKRGITIRATTDNNQDVEAYCRRFHANYKATGIYNIQCILTEEGQVFSFEVNPRVSTTFCLAIAAGYDPFEAYLEQTGAYFSPSSPLLLKRNWHNTISKVSPS